MKKYKMYTTYDVEEIETCFAYLFMNLSEQNVSRVVIQCGMMYYEFARSERMKFINNHKSLMSRMIYISHLKHNKAQAQ